MKYTKESIIVRYNAGEDLSILAFSEYTPDQDKITKNCLNQWFDCRFELFNTEYHTAEQYMMAQKASLFHDYGTLHKIMAADNPRDYKALGQEVQKVDAARWDQEKYRIVLMGNLAKFSQNPELFHFLNSTGDSVLVSGSPDDAIWGVQLSAEDPRIQNPNEWHGENLLGFTLMEVRDILREWDAFQWNDVEWNSFLDQYHKDGDAPDNTYYDSTAFVFKDGQMGVLRSDGSEIGRKELLVFYPQWDSCEEMRTGYTLAADPEQDAYCYFSDVNTGYYMMVFKNAYYFIRTRQGDKYGVVDTAGRVITPCKWDEIDSYGNARQGDQWGFVNLLTCEETPPQWSKNQKIDPYKKAFYASEITNWDQMFSGAHHLEWKSTMTLFYPAVEE